MRTFPEATESDGRLKAEKGTLRKTDGQGPYPGKAHEERKR